MATETHINVTVDFSKWGGGKYDLRIPKHQTVKQLLLNLHETLDIPIPNQALFAIKVTTKQFLIADEDSLKDYPITDGDMLTVL